MGTGMCTCDDDVCVRMRVWIYCTGPMDVCTYVCSATSRRRVVAEPAESAAVAPSADSMTAQAASDSTSGIFSEPDMTSSPQRVRFSSDVTSVSLQGCVCCYVLDEVFVFCLLEELF
jgi:hypothetical protein